MHPSLDLQPPFESIRHKWYPASGTCDAFGVLTLSGPVYAKIYFHEPAEIDEVIAELVALRAEMAPPEPGPYDEAIRQAEIFAQPGNTIDDILAAAKKRSA
jgi:hypothetical protein